jgi:hypothetical protein
MASNPQLKDYIDQQSKLGVSKDAVKAALLGAGWPANDIAEAMGEGSSPMPVSMPIQPRTPDIIKPVEMAKPVGVSTAVAVAPSSVASKPFVASDIFQPRTGEPVFQARSAADQKNTSSGVSTSFPAQKKRSWITRFIIPESIGLVALLFMIGTVFFYMQTGDLQAQLAAAKRGGSSSDAAMTALTAQKNDLTNQITGLNATIADLTNQLSIYAMPANASKTEEIAIDVKGMLSGGGKVSYTITTNKDIVVSVKNSTDPKVDATLKPLLGTQVELSGTHLVHSDMMTVVTVNGAQLQSPAPAATSTPVAATTTPKAATSTQ